MPHQLGAPPIIRVLLKRVLTAVKLDHELRLPAGEIDDPTSDRMLAPGTSIGRGVRATRATATFNVGCLAA